MILVADMSPLHYLILIGAEQILPRLFVRVLTPPAVIAEMSRADTPERVRDWASSPPAWIQVKQPTHIEEIPSLGRKGDRGAGEKAAISLACEEGASIILMDDKIARFAFGLHTVRGLIREGEAPAEPHARLGGSLALPARTPNHMQSESKMR